MDENPYQSPQVVDAPLGRGVAWSHRVAREAATGAVAGGAIVGLLFGLLFCVLFVLSAVESGGQSIAMSAGDIVAVIAFCCVIAIGSAAVGAIVAGAWQVVRNIQASRKTRHVFQTDQENRSSP